MIFENIIKETYILCDEEEPHKKSIRDNGKISDTRRI